FPIPIGFICLFGQDGPIFMPGEAGYDLRFGLERAYKRSYSLPALAGITSDVVALDGNDVSYGITYCPDCASPLSDALPNGVSGFVQNHHGQYEPYAPVNGNTMLLPFVSGSLFGLYTAEVPPSLPGGTAVSATIRLRVGPPGVSYQIDKARNDQGQDIGTLHGIVRETDTELPVVGARVIVVQGSITSSGDQRQIVSSALSDASGRYTTNIPPGSYSLIVRQKGHPDSAPLPVTVTTGQDTYFEPHLPRAAILAVEITDATGRYVPGKVTVDAAYDAAYANQDPKTFLYDLKIGDPYRPTDLEDDTADPETRRFIETTTRASDGRAVVEVRPGTWRVTVSRGPAYAIVQQTVTLEPGVRTNLAARLGRLLPDTNTIAADLHVHSIGSVDSGVTLDDRALSYAAEGIDFLVNTDHNYVTDLRPVIQRLGLNDFLQSTPGVELSSLEAGHWNAYPLTWDPVSASHGSMPWFRRPPADLFADLRSHGAYGPAETVVEVNHPRDAVQGYFTAYGVTGDQFTGAPAHDWPGKVGLFAPTGPEFGAGKFSDDFDAFEVFNGKRFDLLRTYRVPAVLPPAPLPKLCTSSNPPPKPCLGATGTIVRDSNDLVAYPGALEDWEHLLESGRRITAVGNSDSHELIDGEAGYPRNLIDLGHPVASAREISDLEVARAIRAGKVVLTNGPEVKLTLLDPTQTDASGNPIEHPVGEVVTQPADGKMKVHIVVDAAPWVDVKRGAILVSRPGCDETYLDCRETLFDVPPSDPKNGGVRRLDVVRDINTFPGKDAWVAVWVEGDKTLWPVVIQFEVPPLLLNDAIGALTSAFGLSDALGNLHPTQKGKFHPFALTNPVFIDGTGDHAFGTARPPSGAKAGAPQLAKLPDGARALGQGDSGQLRDLKSVLEAWVAEH
ncbi:MAG: carboxypeptidase regulatory-like domain-containing protein, partial [Deltaproteobacteria bacterium]|nr:carboxypeptidase regulatory-like domain-containing protein [Deltaproteobacteria bacterium]